MLLMFCGQNAKFVWPKITILKVTSNRLLDSGICKRADEICIRVLYLPRGHANDSNYCTRNLSEMKIS